LKKDGKEFLELDDNIKDNESSYIFEKANNFVNIISVIIILSMVAILSEIFSHNSLIIFNNYGISIGLAALSIAIISVAPEIFTSIKAARNDEIQRAVNIGMGASTVSILLAVPMIMIISYFIGIKFTLDFNYLHLIALFLSIILAWKTTEDGETNYFEGLSHLMLFLAFIIMIIF
jgi:Ca2+:H+ antiporter